MRKKTKQKKKAENQQNADERPSKKPKHAHATGVQPNSAAPHVKPEQRKKNTGAFAASWSEVAQGKPPPDKGKQSNRTLGPGRPQTEKHKETWSLLNSAWPKAALVQAATVREALEKGIVPTGQACLCQTWNQIEDFQRLAKLHKLEDKAFALLLAQGEGRSLMANVLIIFLPGKMPALTSGLSSCSRLSKPFLICQCRKSTQPMSQRTRVLWPHSESLSPKLCLLKFLGRPLRTTPESLSLRFLVNKLFRPLMVGRKCRLEERGKLNLRSCFRDSFAVRSHQLMPSCN